MTLSRDSKLIRYAYLFDESWDVPEQTTLCALFWRTVFVTLGLFLLGAGIAGALFLTYRHTKEVAGVIATVAAIATLANIVNIYQYFFPAGYTSASKPSVIAETIWGIKNKVCPVIHIARED